MSDEMRGPRRAFPWFADEHPLPPHDLRLGSNDGTVLARWDGGLMDEHKRREFDNETFRMVADVMNVVAEELNDTHEGQDPGLVLGALRRRLDVALGDGPLEYTPTEHKEEVNVDGYWEQARTAPLPMHSAECGGQAAGSPCTCGVGFGNRPRPDRVTCICACHRTGPRSPSCRDCEGRHPTERTIQERMREEADYVELEWGECATSEVMREAISALDAAAEERKTLRVGLSALHADRNNLAAQLSAAETRIADLRQLLAEAYDHGNAAEARLLAASEREEEQPR